MQKKLVPIIATIVADTETPISIFSKLKQSGAQFLLESAERGEQVGRYSIIMLAPQGSIRITDSQLTVDGELESVVKSTNPFKAVKEALGAYEIVTSSEDFPFMGGIAGYFSYDCIRYVETIKNIPEDDVGFPDMHVYLFRRVVVYDHLKHSLSYINLINDCEAKEKSFDTLKGELESDLNELLTIAVPEMKIEEIKAYQTSNNMNRAAYEAAVSKAKHYIKEGDIFQVVISRRRTFTPAPEPFGIYRKLRSINPSPYMYYLDFKEYHIVGSSPECLTRVINGKVETFPIAGTRPRGNTSAEDEEYAKSLLDDEKECAEHAMLVDLGRNDIGGISEFGSVAVEDYMHIEYFSHVMHMVTRVTGHLKDGVDAADALMHCLPAGTVSGAPKIRAMEIIDELENTKRGPYAGAVGYIDFSGNMDMCITIRTMMFKDDKVHAQAGAGIVFDSVPEKEFIETENKLGALFKALGVENKSKAEVK